jgi:hypothetical protein
VIRDIADLLHGLAELVRDTRDLTEAVKDGRKFLAREHPEAKAAIVELLAQMRTTIVGLAGVTALITSFRFTDAAGASASEAARFNNHMIAQKERLARLRNDIRQLKGNCDSVRRSRDKLNALAGDPGGWSAMFRLFGVERQQREQELASTLSQFYADDQHMIILVERVLDMAMQALSEADAVFGPPAMADPNQVGAAAAVLGVYAAAFGTTEHDLESLANSMDDAIQSLSG